MWQNTLVRAVIAHVRLFADAASLAVRVARAQVVARVVARHLCASSEARLVHLIWPVACCEQGNDFGAARVSDDDDTVQVLTLHS